MRDWLKELAPGTLLCRKVDKVFALVINVRTQSLPIGWTQLHLMLLTSPGELTEVSVNTEVFYDSWLKVLT